MKGVYIMADTMTKEASGRRATAVAAEVGGNQFNAFAGVVNTTLPVDSGSAWAPLYNGIQDLISGDITYLRITSTDNLYPEVE